ncbi:MAG: hypothetical protein RIT45_2820 [Pseudomonadota bacterium]
MPTYWVTAHSWWTTPPRMPKSVPVPARWTLAQAPRQLEAAAADAAATNASVQADAEAATDPAAGAGSTANSAAASTRRGEAG